MFRENLKLARLHLMDVIEQPDQYDWIPEGAHVLGLPLNDRELFDANMKLAQQLALAGDGVPIILIPERARRKNVTRKSKAKSI